MNQENQGVTPKYLRDIDQTAIAMPFGELNITITRHRSTTPKVIYFKNSTIEPKTNEQAFSDLQTLLNGLITANFTGKAQFDVDYKNGTIQLLTIKNKEIKNYGSSIPKN